MPFASSVELLKDNKTQAGLVYTQLAQSSADAWRQKGFFVLNPTVPLKPGDDKGPFALGYTAEGKFKSFFAGKPFPNEKGEKIDAAGERFACRRTRRGRSTRARRRGASSCSASANVVSDLYIAGVARYVPAYQIDLAFALNVIDWLAQDKALSSIRAKAITQRPITVLVGVDADHAASGQHRRRAASVHPVRRDALARAVGAARARQALARAST